MQLDERGLVVTSEIRLAVERLDRAAATFAAHRADASLNLAAALEADPGLAVGHCFSGVFQLLLARPELVPPAERSLALARAALAERGGTPREHGLETALARWCAGDMRGAAERLDHVLEEEPLDLMTGKVLHTLRFMIGDAAGMRRSAGRQLARWPKTAPARGYLLGWLGFSLGETGDLVGAERLGRQAVEEAPDDIWGCHAVVHVYEMQHQPATGLAWLAHHADRWAAVNNFARHLHWHHALYHLRRREFDAVLAIYDARIRDERTEDYRDMANAISLLRRLEAEGVAVGGRWEELATLAEARQADHVLVFAELHRLMAMVGAKRHEAAARQLAEMERWARLGTGTQAEIETEIGIALARRILALAPDDGDNEAALRTFLPRIGGSRVQRQIFERLLGPSPARDWSAAPRRAANTDF
ncbi:MAG TPA: hypothetical protein VKS60_08895 [Stellaceae bacterium]|nr:hypothetical protein [Stellaceae bacterium]